MMLPTVKCVEKSSKKYSENVTIVDRVDTCFVASVRIILCLYRNLDTMKMFVCVLIVIVYHTKWPYDE